MRFDYAVMPAVIFAVGILIVWLSIRRLLCVTDNASGKLSGKGQRLIRRFVLALVIFCTATVTVSSIFNAIAIRFLPGRNPPSGDIYLVSGHRMHISCTGSGSPTIVLESGLGNDSFVWGRVQPALSRTTRVCSYDRAGYGYSDALPAPRDADHIAAELHGLLIQAKVVGPIVLMGHSMGGIYIRDYAARYPEEVRGLIFVDASTPLQGQSPPFKKVKQSPQWPTILLTRLAYITNLPRLAGTCSRSRPGSEAPAWRLLAEGLCHPQFRATRDEGDSFDLSGEETIQTGSYGALPILIFSHDPAKTKQVMNWENSWTQMQEDLKKLSTRSRRIVARNSTHYVQLDRAQLLEKEVSLFVEQIRGTTPQTANYGSKIKE
jgi:pimeloyl-ACP methyl ester carboxylesterase